MVDAGAYEGVGRLTDDRRRRVFGEFDLLYSVATLITGSRAEAKRVLPAVMKAAFRDRGTVQSDDGVRLRLLKLVLAELPAPSAEEWSSSHPAGVQKTPRVAPVADPSLQFTAVAVRKAIFTLGRMHREALALADVAALSYDELATVLGVSRCEAKDRLHAARAVLKDVLTSGVGARFA